MFVLGYLLSGPVFELSVKYGDDEKMERSRKRGSENSLSLINDPS